MSEREPRRASPEAQGDAASGDAVDILLIDDNADFLLLIRRALEDHDRRFRVAGVDGPEEAHALLEQRTFDLVLLDYRFPAGGNGLQMIRRLRDHATYVPTVMVTAFGDEGLAVQAMREGALDFVPKTADFVHALPEVVDRALERGRAIRERIRAREALERRNAELQALNDIAAAINTTRDPDAILSVALHRLAELLDATAATAHRVDESGGYLVARAGVATRGPGGRLSLSEDGDHLLVRSVRLDEVLVESGEPDGARQCVVPLVARARPSGALAFVLPKGREVQPTEGALLSAVGRQVGIALEHACVHAALVETRSYLQDLVANAADEIITIDPWGRITSWNAGAEAVYGWTADEVLGLDWDLLWPEGGAATAKALRQQVLSQGRGIRAHETVRVTRDGGRLDVLLTLSPLTHPDGSPRGVSCIGKNVTSLKLLQAQLIQADKMAAVGQLISGVAHELNNPLTGVLGYAQLVASVDTGERLGGYLERIAAEAARCQRIVQNLLAFARKHEPRASRVDLNEIVRSTLDLRAYDLRVHDVEVEVDLAPGLPTTLADAHQLQQVFVNVINNAQHAMAGGRGRLSIVTRHEAGPEGGAGSLVVSFADNGPGVPEHLRETVFNPFFTTKPVGEGTGLGLSLSYGIVQEHGGEIKLLETHGGGATFEVRLPVLADAGAAETGARPPARAARASHGAVAAASGRRILVVDDQEAVRDMFKDILSRDGHAIESVADGRQALRRIQDGRDYDLIIADLRMPGLSGDRLYDALKEAKPELAGRMVFASGDVVSPETKRFLEATGRPFLPKPFGVEDVRNTVISFFEDRP